MKPLILVLFVFISCYVHSQEPTVKRKIDNTELHFYDKCEVLKRSKSIKQGSFQRYYFKVLGESGQYDHNVRTGIWHFYDVDHMENLIYDFTENKVISFKSDTARQTIISDDRIFKDYVDRPVLYKGSKLELLNYIVHLVRYPQSAYDKWITGQVFVGIVVDENGKAVNYYIDRGLEKSIDEEALRVMSSIKAEWLPAIYQGKPVKSVYIQSMTFKISWD